jgi:hypothetical protein
MIEKMIENELIDQYVVTSSKKILKHQNLLPGALHCINQRLISYFAFWEGEPPV